MVSSLPPADSLSQLQATLSSTQQFQQMFAELRSWLDRQVDSKELDLLPCRPEALHLLLAHTEELQRGVAAQRGSYELIQAEGVSLLATLPADERSALQSRLASLRQDWDGLNHRMSEREARLKSTLSKAETYQQHRAELTPWLEECEQKDEDIHPSLDSSVLDESLQKARSLTLDLDRRQPLLEAFNTAADQLLEQCCVGEEEVRCLFLCSSASAENMINTHKDEKYNSFKMHFYSVTCFYKFVCSNKSELSCSAGVLSISDSDDQINYRLNVSKTSKSNDS